MRIPDDVWIDRVFVNSPWRVRRLVGATTETLAEFATEAQALQFIEELARSDSVPG